MPDRFPRAVPLLKLLLATALGAASLATQAAWPEKPVKLILPYAAGGLGDVLIRNVQSAVQSRLGQPVVIEYRTGASGNIGVQEVIRSAPDGYTLLLGPTNNFVINQYLYPNLGYDPLASLAPVTMLADTPYLVYVNPQVPAATYPEFVAHAKANPGKLNYGSPGNATVPHLSAYMLSEVMGARMTHVPYKGVQPGMQALLANDVQMFIAGYGTSGPLVLAGKLRALAVSANERLKVLPSVPTAAEAGIPAGLLLSNWWAIAAPRGTDGAVVNKLAADIRAALMDAEVQKKYQDLGVIPLGNTPAETLERMRVEARSWKAIVEKSGAKADQ
jgi:tripartite-type tricarboxylate transporter receptor subunit TctC